MVTKGPGPGRLPAVVVADQDQGFGTWGSVLRKKKGRKPKLNEFSTVLNGALANSEGKRGPPVGRGFRRVLAAGPPLARLHIGFLPQHSPTSFANSVSNQVWTASGTLKGRNSIGSSGISWRHSYSAQARREGKEVAYVYADPSRTLDRNSSGLVAESRYPRNRESLHEWTRKC